MRRDYLQEQLAKPLDPPPNPSLAGDLGLAREDICLSPRLDVKLRLGSLLVYLDQCCQGIIEVTGTPAVRPKTPRQASDTGNDRTEAADCIVPKGSLESKGKVGLVLQSFREAPSKIVRSAETVPRHQAIHVISNSDRKLTLGS